MNKFTVEKVATNKGTCKELFGVFFKTGAFTFGGGYAMLPLVQQTVLNNDWITEKQMVDFIAVSESTPGRWSFVRNFRGCTTIVSNHFIGIRLL